MQRVLRRLRRSLPAPVADAARLMVARRLESAARRAGDIRGAAIVLHAVAPAPGEASRQIDPPLPKERLDLALRYLVRRYRLVHASQLPAAARDREAGQRLPVALTFDDDLASHLDHAAPLVARHGATATAFLCGAQEPFWWQRLQAAVDARSLSPGELPHVPAELVAAALDARPKAIRRLARGIEDLQPAAREEVEAVLRRAAPDLPAPLDQQGAIALAGAGWEIGFHTRRHHVLTRLAEGELEAELERRPGPDGRLPRSLAYPHGKAGEREAAAARRAGYAAAFTGRSLPLTGSTDPHLIGRLQPDTSSLGRFALTLARALEGA